MIPGRPYGAQFCKSDDTSNEIFALLDHDDLVVNWRYDFNDFGLVGFKLYALAEVLASFCSNMKLR